MNRSERSTYRLVYRLAADLAHAADPNNDGVWRKHADAPAMLGPVLAEVIRRMRPDHPEPIDLVVVRDAVSDVLVQRPPWW